MPEACPTPTPTLRQKRSVGATSITVSLCQLILNWMLEHGIRTRFQKLLDTTLLIDPKTCAVCFSLHMQVRGHTLTPVGEW